MNTCEYDELTFERVAWICDPRFQTNQQETKKPHVFWLVTTAKHSPISVLRIRLNIDILKISGIAPVPVLRAYAEDHHLSSQYNLKVRA